MAIFLCFAMLLGAALQITNMFGDTFIRDFGIQSTKGLLVEHCINYFAFADFRNLICLTIPFFKVTFYNDSFTLRIAWNSETQVRSDFLNIVNDCLRDGI
jgi:hypothetical protein